MVVKDGCSARVRLADWPVVSVVESDVFQLDVAGLKTIVNIAL